MPPGREVPSVLRLGYHPLETVPLGTTLEVRTVPQAAALSQPRGQSSCWAVPQGRGAASKGSLPGTPSPGGEPTRPAHLPPSLRPAVR